MAWAGATNSGSRGAFWRPGTTGPGSTLDRDSTDAEGGVVLQQSLNAVGHLALDQQRKQLPIYKNRDAILYLLEKKRTLIIVGETGCGKTTQVPQYLYEGGWADNNQSVVCTQPRRVAATSVASRVADEMGCTLGDRVGYCVRFDELCGAHTAIKFVTDGMLVRETMRDPLLKQYSVIMIDEAHERSLHTDILLGLIKKIMRRRDDLRVIVSSATLDAGQFAAYFEENETDDPELDTAAILSVEGRTYPVDIHYALQPFPDYVRATVDTIMRIHVQEPPGDVLAFLTGQEEIDRAVAMIEEQAATQSSRHGTLRAMPFYSTLPQEMQVAVFQPLGRNTRKIVIATNIAETSITIPNIVYVVDAGFSKVRAYDPRTGMEALVVSPVSRASAKQRAGRAGRVKPGKAYRLYTAEAYRTTLKERLPPEIQRANLAPVTLQLKALGIENILRFDFMSPPPPESLIRSLDLLYSLGGLDSNGSLTVPLGQQMVEFPVDPKLAKMLLVSGDFGCSVEMITIAAMLQVQNVFLSPPDARREAERVRRRFAALEGDHVSLLNAYLAFEKHQRKPQFCYDNFLNRRALMRATEIRGQLERYMKRFKVRLVSCGEDVDAIRRCVTAGFFANAAKLSADGTYRTVRENQLVAIHPSSILYGETPPQWVVFYEMVLTSQVYIRDVTVIDPEWLSELAPHFYQYNKLVRVEQ